MSYASLLKIPGTLQSSTGLAALASLGIHGLLWAVLPVLPLESKSLESQSPQTVGLVELTPDEQSRLPQSPSEVTLPPFATQPSVLPPLPPPPFQISALPPLPALPPSLQLLPNPTVSQNSLRTSLPSPKTVRVPPPPPIQNNRSVPSRIAINQTPSSVTNRTYYSEETLPKWRRFTPPPISGLPTNRLTPQPFNPNNFPPSPPIGYLPSPPPLGQQNTNPLQKITPPQNQKVATANQPAPLTPTSPQRIPERTKRELLARRDQLATNRAARPEKSPAPEKTPAREREELETALQQRLRSQPQPNPAGSESLTTAQAIRQLDEYEAQRQKVQEDNPKIETKRPVRQKITTCEKQLDGSVAYINAVVNPQGKIISGPALYTKTGTVDSQKAVGRVRSYAFPATKDTISYDFAVEFDYDTGNCSEPTPEPSPDAQTQQPS